MGFSDRKIQGLCENGKILVKKLPHETVLRTKTLRFLKMGIGKTLQLFREQNTNGISNKRDFGAEFLNAKTKMGSHLFASVLYL